MKFIVVALLVVFSLDWAKTCKNVEYEYKQFKSTFYGWGAKKGCFANSKELKEAIKGDSALLKVVECSAIKKDGVVFDNPLTGYDDETLENMCNGQDTCVWKGGSCKAASCPSIAKRSRCRFPSGNFKNGKCEKIKGDDCRSSGGSFYFPASTTSTDNPCSSGGGGPPGPAYYCPANTSEARYFCSYNWVNGQYEYYCGLSGSSGGSNNGPKCSKLTDYYRDSDMEAEDKYTDADKNECEYECAHPRYQHGVTGPYQYTVPQRKYCHKQLGCLYAVNGTENFCSVWSIWAFVVTLAILIVAVVGVCGALIFFLLFKGK